MEIAITILTAVIVAASTLILQKSFANIISGVLLHITRPFKKGNKVQVKFNGNVIASGYVSKVGLMKTTIKTYDRDMCIIANSILDNCVIINSDLKQGTNRPEHMKFTLDSNIDKIRSIIIDVLTKNEQTTNTEENTTVLVKYEDGSIVVQYNVRTETVDESYTVCSAISERLIKMFNRSNDITLT